MPSLLAAAMTVEALELLRINSYVELLQANAKHISGGQLTWARIAGIVIAAVGKEQQSIGRVRRAGQPHSVTVHRIVLEGPKGEKTLDRGLCERNQDEELIKQSTYDECRVVGDV